MNRLEEGICDWEDQQRGREYIAAAAAKAGLPVGDYLRRRAIVSRAKTLAQVVDLAYWPAIAYGPRIDPTAYAMAERILARQVGARWGDILPDGTRSTGGWDSWGDHGLSPASVAGMWYAAGCRDSGKVRLQVATGICARKGDTLPWLRNYVRGRRWLDANRIRLDLSRKAVAALGRMPWYCRWAAVHGVDPHTEDGRVRRLRIRDLNWAAVKVAQKGSRAAIAAGLAPSRYGWEQYLPEAVKWEDVRHVLARINPYSVPHGTVKALWDGVQESYLPTVQIARLFGRDLAAARRFIDSFGNVHDAGQFTLPASGWTKKGWAALAASYPEQIRAWLPVADLIERELGRVPPDLAEVREVTRKSPDLLAMIGVVGGVLLSPSEREDYGALWAIPPKSFVGVPAPGGKDGIRIGSLHILQLDHDDPIQPLVGRMVNCCQHLHGAAASCARQSWTEGDASIWAVWEDGRMVAQAFVWRSRAGNALVLDSIESLSRRESVAEIFRLAAQSVLGRMGVRKVYVGSNGFGVSDMLSDAKAEDAPECSFAIRYTDASKVRLVCEADDLPVAGKAIRKMIAAAVVEARSEQAAVGPVNELLEGSGVSASSVTQRSTRTVRFARFAGRISRNGWMRKRRWSMSDERWTMKVRHNPHHAVLADVERAGEYIRLLAVRPLDGALPEVEHLIGEVFPNLAELRLALVAALKGVVGDTLDNVLLSARAYALWQQKATEVAGMLADSAVDPESIPDEMAKPLPDGSLVIWVDVPGHSRVELRLPKEDWAWRRRPN